MRAVTVTLKLNQASLKNAPLLKIENTCVHVRSTGVSYSSMFFRDDFVERRQSSLQLCTGASAYVREP